jgi:molecular chaperone DnaJ
VEPDSRFTREGPDVHVNAPVMFTTAALGGYTTVPSLKGEVTLKVPAGTQPGDRAVMRGKGIRVLHRNQYGNQYVHFQVEIPKYVLLPFYITTAIHRLMTCVMCVIVIIGN